ncbi:DNA mismatch repair protein MutT [Salipaludibacillus keqinensis]|uniref:DNA mismatch repair protein MutT n=1 Tax=Salipaludibacillus keqinensis TaxID=2045207 RepID=A0A323TVU4_9BACI|nr:NUDIX hydrolase [Salipaludibacillus keqinensis]PYZ93655.1 DNA mismatch repair protein MutT [Salipaludibacillus keqinensis]
MSYYQTLRKYVGNETLILPGAAVIIYEGERVLLQKRDDGDWGLPGGLMEVGESFEETAMREVKEETGLTINKEDLVKFDTFSGKDYYVEAPNGDPYYAVTLLFTTNQFSGELTIDLEETLDLKFFEMNELPNKIRASHLRFIRLFQEQQNL